MATKLAGVYLRLTGPAASGKTGKLNAATKTKTLN
jgi:hypothetical protein